MGADFLAVALQRISVNKRSGQTLGIVLFVDPERFFQRTGSSSRRRYFGRSLGIEASISSRVEAKRNPTVAHVARMSRATKTSSMSLTAARALGKRGRRADHAA